MIKLAQNKIAAFFLNTTVYKAFAVCMLILTPAAPFCFFTKAISVVCLLWGAVILVADLLGERRFMKAPFSAVLLAFILCYTLTLVCFIKNDIISTVNVYCWMFIEFFLLYAFSNRKSVSEVYDEITKINIPVTVVCFVCALVSLVLFLLRITVIMDDPTGINAGWEFGCFDNERNSGIFNNPIPCASAMYIGAVASIWNAVSAVKRAKERGKKPLSLIFYIPCLLACMVTLFSTVTRSFVYGSYLLFLIFGFAGLYMYLKKLGKTKVITSLLACILAGVLAAGAVFCLHGGVKLAVTAAVNAKEPIVFTVGGESGEDISGNRGSDDITLDRGFASNIFGTRASLWRVGVDVIKHSPVLGFTSGNRVSTSLEYDTTGYLKKKFTQGIETYHNAYVDIAVSAGLLGLAIILLFIILNVIKSVALLFSRKCVEDPAHYGLTAAYCAVHVCFISLFFGVIIFSNISSCLYFWLLFGALARVNELCSGRQDKLKISTFIQKLAKRNGGAVNE